MFSFPGFPGPPQIVNRQIGPVLLFPQPNRPKSNRKYVLKTLKDVDRNCRHQNSVEKIFEKKYIPIRLKICMPLWLTVRLANVVEFWGKSKI
jgi:hypothetical protein